MLRSNVTKIIAAAAVSLFAAYAERRKRLRSCRPTRPPISSISWCISWMLKTKNKYVTWPD